MACQQMYIVWGKLERVKGIEPSSSAWEAAALPLSYTRTERFTFAAPHDFRQGLTATFGLNAFCA